MTNAIDLNLGTRLLLDSPIVSSTNTWRVSIRLRMTQAADNYLEFLLRDSDAFQVYLQIQARSDFDGYERYRIRNSNTTHVTMGTDSDKIIDDGEWHDIDIYTDGTTAFVDRDGVNILSGAANTDFTGWDTLHIGAQAVEISYIRFYESTDTSNLIHSWEVDASDTSNTGQQPVLVDSVSGNNATGVGYPTDGSAFFVEPASITTTNPPQGGELFSFSGSNYAAQPVGPMTFTQGTRTISRAVTISNWNAEDGSFTGVTDTALPGVPAAGASDTPALLYGETVTINLPDPGA